MNAAARTARGHHLALMIDGAHMLTPGVLREAAEAIAEAPGAVIGLRQWFIGGDQRFLAHNGWTQAQEDLLFDRIAWPSEGYDLFRIAAPMRESPNHWFDGMGESNCLFVPASVFAAIGGFDEAFDEPGGGYANLDLFRRAFEATAEPPIALLGEASFHQFHGGTTTNVRDDDKDRLVRAYEYKYAELRGRAWEPINSVSIRLRGQVRTQSALGVRQRPSSPARIGVTDVVRQSDLATHLDESARDYLACVYVEAGLDQRATWRGVPLGVAPADALEIGAILHEVRPSHIVAVHAPAGLIAFLGEAARGHGGSHFIVVGEGGIGGSDAANPLAPATLRKVRHALGAATDIVVLLGARAQSADLLGVLLAYGDFVSLRSYMVVLGSARGQPWLGYARVWPMKAINSFAGMRPFAVDRTRTAHLLTSCPLGFLQRIGPLAALSDDISDILEDIGAGEDIV
jgi:cephalosporin hydroxylase